MFLFWKVHKAGRKELVVLKEADVSILHSEL